MDAPSVVSSSIIGSKRGPVTSLEDLSDSEFRDVDLFGSDDDTVVTNEIFVKKEESGPHS